MGTGAGHMVNRLFEGNPQDACPTYLAARSGTRDWQIQARANCEDLWRVYEPYADEHFLSQFPLHFHQRWFEMWLTVHLLRSGYDVECRKPGPDIRLQLDDRTVWLEAVCATAGEEGKKDSVPKPVYGRWSRTPMDAYVLRASNALGGKARKFKRYIENGIVGEDDLAVIAINVHEVGLGNLLRDVMKLALYGSGNPVPRFDRFTKDWVDVRHEELHSVQKKSTGAGVSVQPFLDGSIPHVTAVWGFVGFAANSSSDIDADCIQSPNLSSRNPWPEGMIPMGKEWFFDMTSGELIGELR